MLGGNSLRHDHAPRVNRAPASLYGRSRPTDGAADEISSRMTSVETVYGNSGPGGSRLPVCSLRRTLPLLVRRAPA